MSRPLAVGLKTPAVMSPVRSIVRCRAGDGVVHRAEKLYGAVAEIAEEIVGVGRQAAARRRSRWTTVPVAKPGSNVTD